MLNTFLDWMYKSGITALCKSEMRNPFLTVTYLIHLIMQMNWINHYQMIDVGYTRENKISIKGQHGKIEPHSCCWLGEKRELWFGIPIDRHRDESPMKFIFKCHFHSSFLSMYITKHFLIRENWLFLHQMSMSAKQMEVSLYFSVTHIWGPIHPVLVNYTWTVLRL